MAEEIQDFTLSPRGQNIETEDLDIIINLINKNVKKSYYQNLGIYDSYKKITGNVHSFTEHELQKILFHLVKNHENSRKHHSRKMDPNIISIWYIVIKELAIFKLMNLRMENMKL